MAETHIRNVVVPYSGSVATVPENVTLFMMREMYLAGGWQEIEKDADSAWTSASNILLPLSDFAVTIADPQKVTSPTGGFDAATHEGWMLSLFASDGANRGLFNIRSVVNSNTLYVDKRTRPMAWNSDESGITGRIHKASLGDPFTVGGSSYFVVQAPAASGRNLQLRYQFNNGDDLNLVAYPLGDYLTAGSVTSQWVWDSYNLGNSSWNGYFSDPAASEFLSGVYVYSNLVGTRNVFAGELFNVAAGDSNPGFVQYDTDWDDLTRAMYMLNEANVATSFYPSFYVWNTTSGAGAARDRIQEAKRINRDRFKVYNPMVVGENASNGGFIRGNTPRFYTNYYAPNYDEFGTDFWSMTTGALVPRNGADDVFPFRNAVPL